MNKNELKSEIDMLQGNINRMMVSDDIEEISKMYYWANKRVSTIFMENIERVIEEERIRNQIFEETAEIESDYDVEVSYCVANCSTRKNNVEFPPPHTCDICTSLGQEE